MSGATSVNSSTSIKADFHNSAKPADKKPKRGRKSTPRITLRLTEDENNILRERAGNLSVSSYVRECLFEKDTARRKRRSYRPVADQQALAQVLSKLGQSRMASNLNQIAHHANAGSLIVNEATLDEMNEAAATIAWMRVTLIQALGLKDQNRS